MHLGDEGGKREVADLLGTGAQRDAQALRHADHRSDAACSHDVIEAGKGDVGEAEGMARPAAQASSFRHGAKPRIAEGDNRQVDVV
jgi:hypothetical protein